MNTSVQVQYKSNFPSGEFVNRLSNVDLLGQLIGVEESRNEYHGSLSPFFSEGPSSSHTKCAVARELVKRWLYEEVKHKEVFADPRAVLEYLKVHFSGRGHESFVVLFLDAQNRLIEVEEVAIGTLTQASVYPREIVKKSLRFNCASVLFSHNHPSGVATPSRADEILTQTLKKALALIDVKVLDHIIIAGSDSRSFAEMGIL